MHPNYCRITILLVFDLCSSLAYFMMTHPLPIAGKLPIKTLVASQLPTNSHVLLSCVCVCVCVCACMCWCFHACKLGLIKMTLFGKLLDKNTNHCDKNSNKVQQLL